MQHLEIKRHRLKQRVKKHKLVSAVTHLWQQAEKHTHHKNNYLTGYFINIS